MKPKCRNTMERKLVANTGCLDYSTKDVALNAIGECGEIPQNNVTSETDSTFYFANKEPGKESKPDKAPAESKRDMKSNKDYILNNVMIEERGQDTDACLRRLIRLKAYMDALSVCPKK